jgi:hypothetical protein
MGGVARDALFAAILIAPRAKQEMLCFPGCERWFMLNG